jgi:hypothetical protein
MARKIDLRAWTIQMFDRLGLVTSRMRTVGRATATRDDIDELRDLRVGLNIGTLRDVGEGLGQASRSALQGVLRTVSNAYNSGLGTRRARAGMGEAIDRGITTLAAEAPSPAMRDGLAALIGLRLDLAPGSQYANPHTL